MIKTVTMQKKDAVQIMREFEMRRGRQLLAIGVALFIVFALAMLYRRPMLVEFSKDTLFGAQALVIAAFAGFSSFNWRCPCCNKYLGNDINRCSCKNCRSRLR